MHISIKAQKLGSFLLQKTLPRSKSLCDSMWSLQNQKSEVSENLIKRTKCSICSPAPGQPCYFAPIRSVCSVQHEVSGWSIVYHATRREQRICFRWSFRELLTLKNFFKKCMCKCKSLITLIQMNKTTKLLGYDLQLDKILSLIAFNLPVSLLLSTQSYPQLY